MSRYSFDIVTLVSWLLPIRKRKTKTILWLKSLLFEIKKTQDEFIVAATKWDKDLLYSPGHKMQVEQMLNDVFGVGITVTNNTQEHRPLFGYELNDALNAYGYESSDVRNSFVGNDDAFDINFKNYTVNVPPSLNADLNKMKAELRRYTRSGVTYQIIES